jgi:hypothetical protein
VNENRQLQRQKLKVLRQIRLRELPGGEVEILGTIDFSGNYRVSPDAGDISFVYWDDNPDDGWKPRDIYYKKFRNRAQIATGRKQRPIT